MRIVSKNELIILMGSDYINFVDFCFTSEGSKIKWMFEQATSYDIDEQIVQGFVIQLNSAGIISNETKNRIMAIPEYPKTQDVIVSTIEEINLKTWKLDYPAQSVIEYSDYVAAFCEFSGDRNIFCTKIGEFSLDGICNHPDALELI